MKNRPISLQISCLVLGINTAYLIFTLFGTNIPHIFIKSYFTPFAKLWWNIYFIMIGIGLRNFNWLAVLLIIWNLSTIWGVLKFKKWAYQSLICIFVVMICFGVWYPKRAYTIIESMQTYICRSNNAYVYDHYYKPVADHYRILHGQKPFIKENPTMQYEPFFIKIEEQQKEISAKEFWEMWHKGKYTPASFDVFPNPQEVAEDLDRDPPYGSHWALILMSKNESGTAAALNDIIFLLFKIILMFWFVFIPLFLIYYLIDPQIKSLFGIQKRNFFLFFLIIICSVIIFRVLVHQISLTMGKVVLSGFRTFEWR